jgi:hypothetical protein
MPGDENHLDLAVALESISQDYGFDAPDVKLETVVSARRRPRRSGQLVDRTDCGSTRLQRD